MANRKSDEKHLPGWNGVGCAGLIARLDNGERTGARTPINLFKLLLLALALAAFAFSSISMRRVSAFSSGPPTSQTGAPSEGTCASCHFSFPLNSGGGAFGITGVASSYTPGEEMNITVTLTQTNRALYGFQLTAVDDTGRGAGTIIVTDPSRTQTSTSGIGGGRTYINHTFNGTSPTAANQGSWTFRWRAPAASVGRVTFYAAGNAANGNGSTSGDFIYTTTASTQPAQPMPAPAITSLNPNQASAGGAGFTLNIAGANFVNGSVVRWNSADRVTTFISGTQLTAAVPASDIANAGTAAVTVANPGGAVSQAATFTIASSGLEADVTPRGATNGLVTISDWVQVGRFATGLDATTSGSEFQRADCAPKESLGNGLLSISDWVQAGRYAAGLDPVVPAGGPTSPISSASVIASNEDGVPSLESESERKRVLRLVRAPDPFNRITSWVIQLDAQGDENGLGFSLEYDPRRMRFAGARLNSDLSRAAGFVNVEQAESGRIGVMLTLPAGQQLAAGAWPLITIHFLAVADESLAEPQVSLGDYPVAREVADANANPLFTIYAGTGDFFDRGVTGTGAGRGLRNYELRMGRKRE